ncbi:phosphopantetheine adenylyltransferase [Gardnerella vaginalis]|uniref:Phosphopantetheine adenylyltransferase n=1 Tax=Gardnerella vaginalis TaxID=2702 RepID=A0A3E1IR03_GARVA|nr:pantetheine-phosphate adenylyltransferase [Gardnerella vaginalis]RFD75154.1 phosphopantetheine adenylyltransferase [Gardnerella vaginalis]RIY18021.1 pantetheine-phosphate adenylyltransferase [Bifidobacteriaceae bacterium WP012]
MTIAVCPGSYDPVTAGHLDVIQRCTHLFDEVHVLVAVNAAKTPLFSESERVQIIREAVKNLRSTHSNCADTSADTCSCNNAGKIVVSSTTGLITDYCKKVGATAIVKGLRQNGDYEAELGMALVNRKLAGIETLFLPADPILEHVSSSVVKDVARHGGNVTGMVPDNVIPLLQKLFAEQSSDQNNNSVTLNN